MTTLRIAHFNNAYQVSDRKIHVDGQETVNVAKFVTSWARVTSKWEDRNDGKKDGLVIFSGGPVFSLHRELNRPRKVYVRTPVPPPGIARIHVNIPWLLSNIIDTNIGKVPESMKEGHVLERRGLRIGPIGLAEKDWIATITRWPANIEWQDCVEVGKQLSAKLRDPAEEYKVDLVFAITHCRISNDINSFEGSLLFHRLVKQLAITSEKGVNLFLGGHDHVYWISKGVNE
ncbi:hypothetical protein AN958_04316 [Leucoagaricus sp. SymC.cos]|nr:hypothetical protein AN958_04316 [Leucoagaricus sp. SymC.cos]